MPKEVPRYVPPDEAAKDGFFPDEEHKKIGDDMPGMGFNLEGNTLRSESGTIIIGGKDVKLPPHVRQKVETIERVHGLLRGRPATLSNRGGGLITINTKLVHIRTRKKATTPRHDLT